MNIVMLISKSFVFKMFFVYTKTESRRFEVGGLKSVLEKLRYREGLARTVGITFK